MVDKLDLQGESRSANERLFSESSIVPLPDDVEQENPWGDFQGVDPVEQEAEYDTPPSPPTVTSREKSQPPNGTIDDALPPIYSGPSAPSTPSHSRQDPSSLIPGLPPISFSAYAPVGSAQSNDRTSIRIKNPPWCSSADAFMAAIVEQTLLPPMPEIRINAHVVHTRINMMRYFLPKDGQRGLSYVRPKPMIINGITVDAGFKEAIDAFLAEPARPKRFTVTRTISNWDTEFLLGRIHALAASLDGIYNLKVEFPVRNAKFTVIVEAAPGSRSLAATIRDAFAAPKDYGVEVMWPYANTAPAIPVDEEGRQVIIPRKCLVRSEEGWWNDWKEIVREALRSNHQGWIGMDEWMEMASRPARVGEGR